tara:strand:+ start:5794 stop:6474 length:681 start_codon:yes stop_codon:yes gene_type:complete
VIDKNNWFVIDGLPIRTFLVFLSVCHLGSGSAWGDPGRVVREIDIVGLARTRPDVVQRELLFQPGDRLSQSVVDETARNLRALLFLGEVDIRLAESGEDSVDVTVSVRDLYARAVAPLLSGEPDELSYGAVAMDYNLFGSGRILQVTGRHDAVTGGEGELFYRAPRWMGSRGSLTAIGGVREEGYTATLGVSRPFYQLAARWSAGVRADAGRSLTRLYAGGAVVER